MRFMKAVEWHFDNVFLPSSKEDRNSLILEQIRFYLDNWKYVEVSVNRSTIHSEILIMLSMGKQVIEDSGRKVEPFSFMINPTDSWKDVPGLYELSFNEHGEYLSKSEEEERYLELLVKESLYEPLKAYYNKIVVRSI